MNQKNRTLVIIIAIILLPIIISLQVGIDPGRGQFQPGKKGGLVTQVHNSPVALPGQFMIGALIGFREVIAGLLWVRCDDFFHDGNYEAIVPLMRVITWLDPHQIDVYCTGGWHMAYNFTDSNQRADYRYLPSAIALMKEGVENNPGVQDIEQDLGFVLYEMKAVDFKNTIYWEKKASKEKSGSYVSSRLLAHAYEDAGQLDNCEKQWNKCVADTKAALENNPKDASANSSYQVSLKNRDQFLARRVLRADLPKRRVNLHFDAQFKRLAPRVFQLSGTASLPKGSRVRVELYDADYKPVEQKTFAWDIDQSQTLMVENGVHGLFVDKGKFQKKYDFTKDLKQYPLKKDKYILKVSIVPGDNSSRELKDMIGFVGEGLADQPYLDTSIPGERRLVKTFKLTRKDLT